jgi:cytochrome P450
MDEIVPALPPKFVASDPTVQANPYPTYARLRTSARVCRGGPGEWVVTRYADVAALLGDPRLRNHFPTEYHTLSAGNGPAGEFLQRIVLHQDQPKHKCLRQLLARGFDRDALGKLRGRIKGLVDDLLAPALDTGYLEAVHDLALPLPVIVVCEMMGIPPEDREEIRPKIFDLGKAFAPNVTDGNRNTVDGAVAWLRRYTSDLLQHRRRDPGDDLVSRVLAAEKCGDWSDEEIIDNLVFLFFAGFETTTSVISTGCAALLEHAEQLARLREAPSLIPRAVEEFMRYDAPIQSRLRFVQEAIEIGERMIKPGRLLLLLLGSANHDERQFVKPEELDVTRNPNPHLSFGGGDHYCLGAGLARMESAVVFERLLYHFQRLEPAGETVRNVGSPFRTYERVPLAVRATQRGNDL